MFSAPARKLQFPLDRISQLTVTTPAGQEVCGLPEFPEDSDEEITVLFRLSLNQFVVLASAIDAGSDIAYGADGQKVWWLWIASVMCAQFCEEMAQCLLDENPAVVDALSQLIATNPQMAAAVAAAVANAGGGTPGEPLTPEQQAMDTLPENVRDEEDECILDALWGGMLYFVQSGNRVISDFFEVLEVATNTLENMEIVSRAIPAAGDYIATAAAFADQIAESLQEGYAGAYTEAYEQSLACDLFCASRDSCELTPAMIMAVINARLTAPLDIGDFGELMAGVASGTWVGDEIADVMFLIYFGALVYGQQFLSTIGIRPLTVIISLGADQLSSDNWTVLCECGEVCEDVYDFTIDEQGWENANRAASWNAGYVAGVGWRHTAGDIAGGSIQFGIKLDYGTTKVIETIEFTYALSVAGNTLNIANFAQQDGAGGSFGTVTGNVTLTSPGGDDGASVNAALAQSWLEMDALCYSFAGAATLTVSQIKITYTCP